MKASKFDPNRPSIIWHCILVGLLLVSIASFLYLRHRLFQQVSRWDERSNQQLEGLRSFSSINQALLVQHESNLVFVAISDFQSENNKLPSLTNEIIERRLEALGGDLANRDLIITIQNISNASLSNIEAIALPGHEDLHIWPGFACNEVNRENYHKNTEEVAYNQLIETGSQTDFAIVYGVQIGFYASENPYTNTYVKCLDSQNGFDKPDFIIEMREY